MEYTITLTDNELKVIGAALAPMPYAQVALLVKKIDAQYDAQNEKLAKEQAAATENAPDTVNKSSSKKAPVSRRRK